MEGLVPNQSDANRKKDRILSSRNTVEEHRSKLRSEAIFFWSFLTEARRETKSSTFISKMFRHHERWIASSYEESLCSSHVLLSGSRVAEGSRVPTMHRRRSCTARTYLAKSTSRVSFLTSGPSSMRFHDAFVKSMEEDHRSTRSRARSLSIIGWDTSSSLAKHMRRFGFIMSCGTRRRVSWSVASVRQGTRKRSLSRRSGEGSCIGFDTISIQRKGPFEAIPHSIEDWSVERSSNSVNRTNVHPLFHVSWDERHPSSSSCLW